MATASLNSLNPAQIGQATALVSLVGFAIQQAIQAFDTFVSAGIDMLKAKRPSGTLPGGLTDADFKKSVMVFLSFSLGLAAVLAVPDGKLYLLSYAGITTAPDWLDLLVSALVFSAGTEGANTVLKYFGYVKDARKKPAIELDVVPKTVTVSKGATLQFIATAKNGEDSTVTWQVLTGGGGTVSTSGLYTAPTASSGTYQLAAVSTVNPAAVALATVTVS